MIAFPLVYELFREPKDTGRYTFKKNLRLQRLINSVLSHLTQMNTLGTQVCVIQEVLEVIKFGSHCCTCYITYFLVLKCLCHARKLHSFTAIVSQTWSSLRFSLKVSIEFSSCGEVDVKSSPSTPETRATWTLPSPSSVSIQENPLPPSSCYYTHLKVQSVRQFGLMLWVSLVVKYCHTPHLHTESISILTRETDSIVI